MRAVLAILLLLCAAPAYARDAAQVRAFRKDHPCPSTGKTTGACPGYVVDHLYPLCAGGEDKPANMQWQELTQSYAKDRLERELCALKERCPLPTPAPTP